MRAECPVKTDKVAKLAAFEPSRLDDQVALLERRLAREVGSRAAAEELLEEKSRVLAAANEKLKLREAGLSADLERRSRQLLEAQKVAGLGTLIIDIHEERLELSDTAFDLLGLPKTYRLRSYVPLLRRVVHEDLGQMMDWIKELLAAVKQGKCSDCPIRAASAAVRTDRHGIRVSKPRIEELVDRHKSCLGEGQQIEVRIRPTGANKDLWLSVMAQIEFDYQCRSSIIFVTVQDITQKIASQNEAAALRQRDLLRLKDLERLNGELSVAREHADRANDSKSRFLAMMSHDIRTPLNGIIGMLSLLEEDGLDEAQRRSLEIARTSSDQLRVLLNDIIDLARAEAGRFDLHPQPTHLVPLFKERADFWQHVAAEKSLALETILSPRLPAWIKIDIVRLRQLVDNLLSNAVKYTDEGGIVLSVDYLPTGRIRVDVIDSGIGIPPERHDDLFEAYGQLNMAGSEAGGAGLGLAICRRIADVMNGEIGVKAADIGSCFWFELPCEPILPPTRVANPVVDVLKGRGGRTPRVLVAEDLATNQIVVKGMLKKFGCEAEIVGNGRDAVYAVQTGDFDVVLMDMAMPVMDGPEATQAIRKLPLGKGALPIIALTAYARPEELAPMREAGVDVCASKPIVADDLRRKLAEALTAAY